MRESIWVESRELQYKIHNKRKRDDDDNNKDNDFQSAQKPCTKNSAKRNDCLFPKWKEIINK